MVTDNEPVVIEIWDAVGRSIYKEQLQFTGAATSLHAKQIVPGLYMLELTDSRMRKFKFKFVVQ